MTSTMATLIDSFDARREAGTLTSKIIYNLARAMRANRVTIRQLAQRMGVTQKRVREVRAMRAVPYLVALDYQQAIEGVARDRNQGLALDAVPKSWRLHLRGNNAELAAFVQAVTQ